MVYSLPGIRTRADGVVINVLVCSEYVNGHRCSTERRCLNCASFNMAEGTCKKGHELELHRGTYSFVYNDYPEGEEG